MIWKSLLYNFYHKLLLLFFVGFLIFFSSCSKINISQDCFTPSGIFKETPECRRAISQRAKEIAKERESYDLAKINNIVDCNKFKDAIRGECIHEYTVMRAIEQSNPEVCNEIDRVEQDSSLWKAWCLEDYAIHSKTPDVCLKINSISTLSPSECLEKVAVNTSNPDICLIITEAYPRQHCITIVAMETKNRTVCDMLDKEETIELEKSGCISNVVWAIGRDG